MDLNSLLVLPDDIFNEIMSYTPLKQRVKHSRTCKRLSDAVDVTMIGVKGRKIGCSVTSIGQKTLSKLKNLQVISDKLPDDENEAKRVVEVLAEHCPRIRRIDDWDIRFIDLFVTGLQAKGLAVALKVIRPNGEPLAEEIAQLVAKVDVQLVVDNRALCDVVTSDFNLINKISEFDGQFIADLTSDPVDYSRFMFTIGFKISLMSNLRKLWFPITGYSVLKHLLDSLPHLSEVSVIIFDNRMMRLLMLAKQKFTGLWFSLRDIQIQEEAGEAGGDEGQEDENQEDGEFDFHLFQQLLQQRGHQLKKLMISAKIDVRDCDLVNILSQTCRRLKWARVSHPLSSTGRELDFDVQDKSLVLVKVRSQSLRLLLQLFPGTRNFYVYPEAAPDPETKDLWMSEMREFAGLHKHRCIRVAEREN